MLDVIVIGAGPAGALATLRAADLGARTALITRDEFGGMAANDGPVPVRTPAHAARLIREARQLCLYGIAVMVVQPEHSNQRRYRWRGEACELRPNISVSSLQSKVCIHILIVTALPERRQS
jgi:pyruvate/2-oxoglutarate dehydrogenase complex dihydrolipoamide dehydrogenase (E3) component